MNPILLALVFLFPALAACGATAPAPPAVSVGVSPTETDPISKPTSTSEPTSESRGVPSLPASGPLEPTRSEEGSGLFLTDGDDHRVSVDTIRTISPPPTR